MTSLKRTKLKGVSLLDDLASDYSSSAAARVPLTVTKQSSSSSSKNSSSSTTLTNSLILTKKGKEEDNVSIQVDHPSVKSVNVSSNNAVNRGVSISHDNIGYYDSLVTSQHPSSSSSLLSSTNMKDNVTATNTTQPHNMFGSSYDDEDTGVAIGLSTDMQSKALLKTIGKKRSRTTSSHTPQPFSSTTSTVELLSSNIVTNSINRNSLHIPNTIITKVDSTSTDQQAQTILDRLGPLLSSLYTYASSSSSSDKLTLLSKMNKNIQLETFKNELNLATVHQQLLKQQKKSEALLSRRKKNTDNKHSPNSPLLLSPLGKKLNDWKQWRNIQYSSNESTGYPFVKTIQPPAIPSTSIGNSTHPLVSSTNNPLLITTTVSVLPTTKKNYYNNSVHNHLIPLSPTVVPKSSFVTVSDSITKEIPPHYFTNEQINTYHRLHRDEHGWLETSESIRILYHRWWKETYALTVRLSSGGQLGPSSSTTSSSLPNNKQQNSTMVSLADMQTALRLEEKARRNANNPQFAAESAKRKEEKEIKALQKAENELPLSIPHANITTAITRNNLVSTVKNWKGVWIHISRCKESRGRYSYGYVTWIGKNNFTVLQYIGSSQSIHSKGQWKPCTLPKEGTWWVIRWPNTLQVPKGNSIDNFREIEKVTSSLGGNEYLVEIACEGIPKGE